MIPGRALPGIIVFLMDYTSDIHSTGHSAAQEPQLMHSFSFIFLFPSLCSDMQETGHTASHAPQAVHLEASIL